MKRVLSLVLLGTAAVVAVTAAVGSFGSPVGTFDEAMQLVGAMLIHRGGQVHVTFTSVYPFLSYLPGYFALTLFGESVIAARAVSAAWYLLFLVGLMVFYRTSGARASRLGALGLASVVLTTPLIELQSLFGLTLALLSLGAYLLALDHRCSQGRRLWYLISAGVLSALALMARPNFGLYVLATIAVDWAVSEVRGSRSDRGGLLFRDLAPVLAPVATALGVFALARRSVLREIVHQIVTEPSTALQAYSRVPLDLSLSPADLVHLLTFGVLLPGVPIAWLALRSQRGRRGAWLGAGVALLIVQLLVGIRRPEAYVLLMVPVLAVLVANQLGQSRLDRGEFVALLSFTFFLHYYMSRPDVQHRLAVVAASVFLLPMVVRVDGWPRLPGGRIGWLLLVPMIGASAGQVGRLASGLPAGLRVLGERALTTASDAARLEQAGTKLSPGLATLFSDSHEVAAVALVRRSTHDGDAVYVGLADHGRPYTNDIRAYWMLGRQVATRRFMLMSGLTNTVAAQSEMIENLESRSVNWAILWTHAVHDATFDRRTPRGPSLLDDYLRVKFRPVATFGEYEVLSRR